MKRNTRFHLPIVGLMVAAALSLGLMQPVLPVSAAASITLSRSTAPQGANVVVSGSGFTPGDTVVVYIDAPVSGHPQRIQATTTSAGSGAFSARLSLPRFVAANTYTLTARDTHGRSATARLTVLPLIVLRTNSTAPTTTVVDQQNFVVDALGFAAHETVKVQVTYPAYNGNAIVQTRTPAADASGNVFGVTLTAPAGAKLGWAAVSATGQTSGKQAQGRVYVTYRPYIFLQASSITPGSTAVVEGRGFVANAQVRVQIAINGSNGTQTLAVTTGTDGRGDFARSIRIPSYANPGTYTVVATDISTGLNHTARLTIRTQPAPKPTPTATPKPSPRYHPSASVVPNVTLPNQDITLTGTGYPGNTTVTVSATVDIRGGGNRVISQTAITNGSGSFTIAIRVPYKAAPGTYTFTASTSNATASSQLQVLALSAQPHNLNFRWVSLWYHTVRQGTWDYLDIQSSLHTRLGIWVHVIFPAGQHLDYYAETDSNGHWAKKFNIPRGSVSRHSNQAYVTLQLWHGSRTAQSFVDFTIV